MRPFPTIFSIFSNIITVIHVMMTFPNITHMFELRKRKIGIFFQIVLKKISETFFIMHMVSKSELNFTVLSSRIFYSFSSSLSHVRYDSQPCSFIELSLAESFN